MSSESSSRSGAKPSAGPPAPAMLFLPSTKGSSMTPRNWLVSWNAPCWAPVAASPESSVSALPRLTPVRPKMFANAPGSVPPLLKKGVDRVGDVALVDAKGAGARRVRPTEWIEPDQLAECGSEIEDHVG